MEYYNDGDATPRPLQVANIDEWAERSPYIPRRKSSNNDVVQTASKVDLSRPYEVRPSGKVSQDRYLQKAKLPIDGHDPQTRRALHQLPLLGGPGLRRPHPAIPQSSSRRFLNRMFSTLAFPSSTSRRQPKESDSSSSAFSHANHRRESKTSSRASSLLSISTAPSSSQNNTVRRRRRRLALSAVRSVVSDSPNPLRAPPSSLLGPRQGNSTISESTESVRSTNETSVESLDIPTLSIAEFHYLTFAGDCQRRSSSNLWVVLEIRCGLTQRASSGSSVQGQSTNKSSNDPGILKRVTLTLSPHRNCQVTTVLGQLTASTLCSDETVTAILLTTLDKSLFPRRTASPHKEHGRPGNISPRNRPTSDLLNEHLLNQLLGKVKRPSSPKDEAFGQQILTAKVTYDHSLFPPRHQISHEETITVTHATTCDTQHSSSEKHLQKKVRGSAQHLDMRGLTTEETAIIAERIICVLREGLSSNDNAEGRALYHGIKAGQAVKLLNDFSTAAAILDPETSRTLEMLKFRYSIVVDENAETNASPERYRPFARRKKDRRKSFEPESLICTPQKAEVDGVRRNAFEVDREEVKLDFTAGSPFASSGSGGIDLCEQERGLADVTNQQRYRNHHPPSQGIHLLYCEDTTDLEKDNAVPPPLFSPKRGPVVVCSPKSDSGSDFVGSAGTPEGTGHQESPHYLQNNIGSASFYAAEVEELARQAFGGATATCYHQSELLHRSMEESERIKDETNDNDKAKMIWERMRISSEGSGTSVKSTDLRYSDESADEAERVRECKVIGAPWLA